MHRSSSALSPPATPAPCRMPTADLLDVHHIRNLDIRPAAEYILEPLQPLFRICLPADREKHHVPLAANLLDHSFAAQLSRGQVVGPDKVKPPASRRVRVDRDHRNPRATAASIPAAAPKRRPPKSGFLPASPTSLSASRPVPPADRTLRTPPHRGHPVQRRRLFKARRR